MENGDVLFCSSQGEEETVKTCFLLNTGRKGKEKIVNTGERTTSEFLCEKRWHVWRGCEERNNFGDNGCLR